VTPFNQRRASTARNTRSNAQSLVDFALVSPLFFLLVFGLLQLALWARWAGVAQLAAREAAASAAGAYLAQYRDPGFQQALGAADSPALWADAEAAGLARGEAVLATAPTPGEPGPFVWLTLNEDAAEPGQIWSPTIRATVAVWMPTLWFSFLPVVPGLDPYVTQVTVRPDRFYSQ
jgi:hypothetical protein